MAAYSNVPIVTATVLLNQRAGGRYAGESNMAADEVSTLNTWILLIVVVLSVATISFIGLDIYTSKAVTETINVSVVRAVYVRPAKSNQLFVAMTLRSKDGYQWVSSERIQYKYCTAVQYDVVKPIWLHTQTSMFGTSAYTDGLVTFCGSSK